MSLEHGHGLRLELGRGFGKANRAVRSTGERDGGFTRTGHHVALVRAAHLDVDHTSTVFDPLVDDLTGEDVAVSDVVELADLAALADQPPVVSHPVGHEV